MATQLLTTDFSLLQADYFAGRIVDVNSYIFAGRSNTALETAATIINSQNNFYYDPYTNMVFGKKIETDDVITMIKKKPWTSGTVYTRYDNTIDLEDEDFYVYSLEGAAYSIFKCLDNNGNANSTSQPVLSETNPSDGLYQTADGYIWKLMYTVSDTIFNKFTTGAYIPFVANTAVSANAVSGSIDIIAIEDTGLGYINTARGDVIQANVGGNGVKVYIESDVATPLSVVSGFYVGSAFYVSSGTGAGQLRSIVDSGIEGFNKFITVDSVFDVALDSSSKFRISPNVIIDGDGTGFLARAVLDEVSGAVDSIEVIARGSDYTYANVTLGANTASFEPETFAAAEIRAILPPKGGHGFDQRAELFGKYVGIHQTFELDEVASANNEYQYIGILETPLFREATIDLVSASGIQVGDTLIQDSSNISGTVIEIDNTLITVANIAGVFDTSNVSVSNTEYAIDSIIENTNIFDQRMLLNITFTSGTEFTQNEQLTQENNEAIGYVHEDTGNNSIYVFASEGAFTADVSNEIIGSESGTKAVINSIERKGIYPYSGNILYVENIDPVTRIDTQTDTIRIVIGF